MAPGGWALWAVLLCFFVFLVEGGRPGLAPAGDLLFLLAQEKKAKEVRPAGCDPAANATGQPVPGNGRGGPQNSLRAFGASFRQLRPVRSRSSCILRCSRHPAQSPTQAHPEGGGSPYGPSLRSAWGSPHPCPLPGGEGVKPGLGGWSLGLCPCPSPSPSLGLGLGLGLGRRLVLV